MTTFTVNSAATLSNAPFAFGHAFKQGDVAAGSHAAASGAVDWQCVPLTYWWDGSTKHAIIAGRVNTTAGVDVSLYIGNGSAPSGVNLTESDLSAAMPTVTIAAGAFTWTLNSSIGTADRHRTVCTGPVMSNFIYRKPVTGNNHLVLWADVRVYKGGNVEIFPWIENAYLLVSSPTNDVRTYTVTIGGSQRFSQSIDVKHHTRIPLMSGTGVFSYWTGTDPQITPRHNTSYMRSTKQAPNYDWTGTSEAKLNSLLQSYTPNTLAGVSSSMGAAGGEGSVIYSPGAWYISTNGDPRAYRAAIVSGLSSGSWSVHHRDEVNEHEPIQFQLRSTTRLDDLPSASGGANGTAAVTHLPGLAYLPWLLAGRWFFLDEMLFWAGYAHLEKSLGARRGANSISDSADSGSARRAAWNLNAIAQSLNSVPAGHPCRDDLASSWEANMAFYRAKYVDGTSFGGTNFGAGWISPQGWMGMHNGSGAVGGPYDSRYPGTTSYWESAFMQNYLPCVIGTAWDYGLLISSAAQNNHQAVRDQAYKQIVGRASDGSNGYNWRHFIASAYPIGGPNTTYAPPATMYTHAQSYAEYMTRNNLTTPFPSSDGQSLKGAETNTDFSSTAESRPYGASALMALSLAADHGYPDARNGYRRITTASNFESSFGPYFRNEVSQFGVRAR